MDIFQTSGILYVISVFQEMLLATIIYMSFIQLPNVLVSIAITTAVSCVGLHLDFTEMGSAEFNGKASLDVSSHTRSDTGSGDEVVSIKVGNVD